MIPISLEEKETRQLADILLTPTAEIKGVLTDAQFQPIMGATIYLISEKSYEHLQKSYYK